MDFLYVDRCNNYNILKITGFIGYIILFIQIVVPIILITLSIIDLVKSISSSNMDKVNNSYKIIIKRFIYGVLIFLIPIIVKFIMVLISQDTNMKTCFWAIANPSNAMEQAEVVRGSYSKSSDFNTKESCEASGRKWIFTHSEVINCQDNGCYICVEKGK